MEFSYTPEYSNELLQFVQDVYAQDIKHYYPKLKLEKLIDLLEHAEYLFESYRMMLKQGNQEDALTAFIIGSFYVYLIIPQSIQFHTRNKSYGIYVDLRKYYQDETSMTNVLLMVTKKVDAILCKSRDFDDTKITRKRAYSVPSQALANQLRSLTLTNTDGLEQLPEVSKESDTLTNYADDYTTIWSAPKLEPDDQLKLALNPPSKSSSATSSLSSFVMDQHSKKFSIGESSSDEFEPTPIQEALPMDHATPSEISQRTRHHSIVSSNDIGKSRKDSVESVADIYVQNVDRYNTHRKDSYHSVYMLNEDDDTNEYDFFQNLSRLQKQYVISCEELMDILQSDERNEVLLVDLRISKRFHNNHIVAPNLINIDPRDLWDADRKVPISSDVELEKKMGSYQTFQSRSKFKYIVYYTDMKTFLNIDFDYRLVFFQLLYASSSTRLRSPPKALLGDYEQWKTFIGQYAKHHDIVTGDYLFRPYASSAKSQKDKVKPISTPPVPATRPPPPPLPAQAPPALPSQVPPTLPSQVPSTLLSQAPPTQSISAVHPPPLPPKSAINPHYSVATGMQPPMPQVTTVSHAHRHRYPSHSKRSQHQHYSPISHQYISVPTIEQSSNVYVSLSITGLRNLGSTCYINSMLQCLFATRKFRDIFLSPKYHDYISKAYIHRAQISRSFHMLFKKMYMNGGCSVVPSGFLKACNSIRPDFKIPNDQQDTQEFLLFLLDQLHDELSDPEQVANDYPQLLLHDDDNLQVDGKEYDKWFEDSISKNGLSPIDSIFQGQMENCLQCQRCGHSSYNYSTFYVLSLAIPTPGTSTFGKTKKVLLEDCINLFTSDEVLSGENAWDCPRCGTSMSGSGPGEGKSKKKRKFLLPHDHVNNNRTSRFFKFRSKSRSRSSSPFNSSNGHNSGSSMPGSEKWKSKKLTTIKTFNFITMPPILVIHLSRFFYDLTKKNSTVITYPLILNIVLKNNEVAKYRLYGIVNHFGNLISGHYTSLVNKDLKHEIRHGQQKWYYFDDEVVKQDNNHGDFDAGIASVSSSDVYVLFYERIYD